MAKKSDNAGGKLVTVSVVGLSGTEKEKGQLGVGKSCLCNRFVRTDADDYNVDHISVLSQSDFSGRVVNNDHFLYWGSVQKEQDEQEYRFEVVEQTEFVDDACFQPFKAVGKTETFVKRCVATKLQSAEKLMYVCKNQLGIEKEYEQKLMPDGKLSVDGFLCVYDVSLVPGRSWEKQNEVLAAILQNIIKLKKPVVLVTSKNDEACEQGVREAERLVQRKEFKGAIPIVETSSHDNVNVDHAFFLLAQMVDKSKARIKVANYAEALRIRRETLDFVTEAFTQLIRIHVQDHKEIWSTVSKRLCHYPEWVKFVQQFGNDGTQVVFRRHIRRLKEERSAKKLRKQLAKLPQVLARMQLPTDDLQENDWGVVLRQLRAHRDFSVYFSESRAHSGCSGSGSEPESPLNADTTLRVGERARYQTLGQSQKIPYEILETNEAASIFKTYLHEAQEKQRNYEWCQQFKRLLEETGYVTPGKQLSEVRVLLMGRECYEALTEEQQQRVYDDHQREIQRRAKHNLQELLLEHADLFYHFKRISPTGTITQEDIKEITDVLQDDFRYKMLDRMEQDRKLMLFQHLGFVHCPMREHCPAAANCLDATLPVILNTRVGSLTSSSESQCHAGPPAAPWALTTDSNQINLIILGVEGIAGEFGKRLIAGCDSERRVNINGHSWRVEQRLRTDDFAAEPPRDFAPNGYFCVYQDQESFEYIRGCAEKTLLSSLEQEDKLPFQGLPLVVMFVQDDGVDKKEIARLQEEGQNLADNLHCSYMEASVSELGTEALTADAIQELIRANREKASYAHLYRDLIVCFDADIRIMVCMFCDDPYSPERVLSPLLLHRACFLTGDRSILIETFLGDSKRKVEVIISSFHGASQFREELIHGFILIYSAKRKASLATLNAFSMNIPNLPIQMVAVTDGGGSAANAFFGTDLGHALITEGNATADRLGAHFTTYTSSAENKSAFYTPFFKEVWERKGEIERAFRLEAPHTRHNAHNPHNLPDVAAGRPAPPPRLHSYHIDHKMDSHKLTNSLDLLIGPDSRADIDSEYSDTLNNSKNRGFLKGFSVYPPPSTPPEPAPPDHRMHADLSPDLNCSEDSLSTHESDGGGLWQPAGYGQRAFTTGRARAPAPHHQRLRHSQTLKQPGKLDMNNYTMVSDALQHITIGAPQHRERKSQRSGWSHSSSQQGGHHHHPSGVSSETELDAQYAQIKETNEYMEAPSMTRLRRHRRHEKTPLHQPSFSETDSSGSSEASGGARAHVRRRHAHHAHHAPRHYKKRSLGNLVAVQSPRVPKLGMFVGPPELPTGFRARTQEDKAASDSSEGSSDGETRRPRPLPPPPTHHEPTHKILSGEYPSSAQDNSSSSAADSRRRPTAFGKHDRRHKEFSKSKDKKNAAQTQNPPAVLNWGPQGPHGVPLFVEKCVDFIEREGLASEGLYRVPGNRAHVDMLFSKFYEDPNIDLEALDIPVNAVATALKDFFSKKLPPLLDEPSMAQLEDIAAMRGCIAGGVELKDRSWRLLALRALLASALTPPARSTLDYLLNHFARVADNSKLNSMDSKNLAICWWPTLLPVHFSDMGRFEMTRPYLEDIVQTMIDQHPFLFRGQEAFVMV
ncbi:rho GTPase-activating protein 190 isoform X1 [Bicyclus anynana]|uniref:Rho GTPase-activating protein 190 isoform X1 n=2 Tax=Bicyclus anynana TaxID=110368 RepID=A0ABM3M2V6_BICAN|nr:rho GTPase-activating protein 190 isoform X1 [Bicyclus anynana]XP_052745229.1 rho GTPase-activating protein 190 isoform X1 [Bicyclus anynana]XP_052745230.1 rho GTPase-activating protein 190 isoform X1 [Bicyclus anynana]